MLSLDSDTALYAEDVEDALRELPPIRARDFIREDRMAIFPVRRVRLISANSQGEEGGSLYAVHGIDTGEANFSVGEDHTPARDGRKAHLDIYLDTTTKIDGELPSRGRPSSNNPPVTDPDILDSIERFIVQDSKPQSDYAIFIHRGDEIHEVTPQGKVRLAQYPTAQVA